MARSTGNSSQGNRNRNNKGKKPNTATGKTDKRARVSWTKDNVEKEDGTMGKSSFDVCIDWISSANNYARWRGDDINGATKNVLAGQVVTILKNEGITNRTAKDVIQKLTIIQSKYTAATCWRKKTGQGIKNDDPIRGKVIVDGKLIIINPCY